MTPLRMRFTCQEGGTPMDKLADAVHTVIRIVTNVVPDGEASKTGEMFFLGRSEALTAEMIEAIQTKCGVLFSKPGREPTPVDPLPAQPAQPQFSLEGILEEIGIE